MTPLKTCTCCGRQHDAASWAALPLKGYVGVVARVTLELRNCTCGSTLAVEVPR